MTYERKRSEIVNPPQVGAPKGFSHGVFTPTGARVLFVAGQTACNASGAVPPAGFVEQFASALDNVLAVVREAGGAPEDIARMTLYVTDVDAYRENLKPLGAVWRERMGRHYPAMSVIGVTALADPGTVVEIEATAAIPQEEAP